MCVYAYGAYQNGAQNDPAAASKLDDNAIDPEPVDSQPMIESELSLTGSVGQALVTGIDVIASAQQDEDRATALSNALGGATVEVSGWTYTVTELGTTDGSSPSRIVVQPAGLILNQGIARITDAEMVEEWKLNGGSLTLVDRRIEGEIGYHIY
jgi:hypothetical protein